jgi:hypothetical protein
VIAPGPTPVRAPVARGVLPSIRARVGERREGLK